MAMNTIMKKVNAATNSIFDICPLFTAKFTE